jgi:hypothetical protein
MLERWVRRIGHSAEWDKGVEGVGVMRAETETLRTLSHVLVLGWEVRVRSQASAPHTLDRRQYVRSLQRAVKGAQSLETQRRQPFPTKTSGHGQGQSTGRPRRGLAWEPDG